MINRANQNWPDSETRRIKMLEARAAWKAKQSCCDGIDFHSSNCPTVRDGETEDDIEFERRQRGSASTVAALIIVAMFVAAAVAVLPLINQLSAVSR